MYELRSTNGISLTPKTEMEQGSANLNENRASIVNALDEARYSYNQIRILKANNSPQDALDSEEVSYTASKF